MAEPFRSIPLPGGYARRALAYLRHPGAASRGLRTRWLVRRDARRLQRRLGPRWSANGHRPSRRPGSEILFVSLTRWPAQVKIESVLAKAFELHGHPAAFLTTHSYWADARPYAAAFGINMPLFFDDLVGHVDPHEPGREAAAILDDAPEFRAILARRFGDAYVGRHALSTLIRSRRLTTMNPHGADRPALEGHLQEAIRLTRAAERLFDEHRPRAVLFLERGYLPYGPIFDVAVARGLNVVQYTGSHRSNGLVLKRYRSGNRFVHNFSLSAESWKVARGMPWSVERSRDIVEGLERDYRAGTWFDRKYVSTRREFLPPDEVRSELRLRPDRKVAAIFPHILWDGTFFHGETLFGDYEAWFVATLRAAAQNPRLDWIVKIHPDHVWKSKAEQIPGAPSEFGALQRALGGELPGHFRLVPPDTRIQTLALFPVVDYVLTVRGTVGIEAACHGKPVLTGGTGRYAGLGFTVDSASEADYLDRLAHLETLPPLGSDVTELARRYAYSLFRLRPWEFESFRLTFANLSQVAHPLANDLELRVQRPEDLRDAPDMLAFLRWVLDSQAEDFLQTPPAAAKPAPRAVAAARSSR